MLFCSMSGIDAMGRVAELLTDMLRAATPGDREVNYFLTTGRMQPASKQRTLLILIHTGS